MQKKIIMTHIMMCALCAVTTNASYAKTEIKPITMICNSDLAHDADDDSDYKVIAVGEEGKTLILTTKEIQVKGKTKELDDYSSDQTIVARCTKNNRIKEHMQPDDDDLNPTLTCPKGSGIEVWFTLSDLPNGYRFSDFTYHAELTIKSDDKNNTGFQNIKNNMDYALPSNRLTSDGGLHW